MAPGSALMLDGVDISKWSAVKRARAGMGRSFQSLELFEDSTVLDNLRAASDPRDMGSYARDLVWPVNVPLPDTVLSTIREFELEDDLDRMVDADQRQRGRRSQRQLGGEGRGAVGAMRDIWIRKSYLKLATGLLALALLAAILIVNRMG